MTEKQYQEEKAATPDADLVTAIIDLHKEAEKRGITLQSISLNNGGYHEDCMICGVRIVCKCGK